MKIILLIALTLIAIDFGVHVLYHAFDRSCGLNSRFSEPYKKIAETISRKLEKMASEEEEKEFRYITGEDEKKEAKNHDEIY